MQEIIGERRRNLPWLRDTISMSPFSFFLWTLSVWIFAAMVGRAGARRAVSA